MKDKKEPRVYFTFPKGTEEEVKEIVGGDSAKAMKLAILISKILGLYAANRLEVQHDRI